MAALLKQAVLPNLVQTLEEILPSSMAVPSPTSPTAAAAYWPLGRRCAWGVLRHGGRLRRGPGRRNFWTSSAAHRGLWPDAAVVVATVRALKLHGGAGTTFPGKIWMP